MFSLFGFPSNWMNVSVLKMREMRTLPNSYKFAVSRLVWSYYFLQFPFCTV